MAIIENNNIKVNDAVLCKVKRIEVVGRVIKIEDNIATCSFFMPRSKGMSTMKCPITELQKVEVKEPTLLNAVKSKNTDLP